MIDGPRGIMCTSYAASSQKYVRIGVATQRHARDLDVGDLTTSQVTFSVTLPTESSATDTRKMLQAMSAGGTGAAGFALALKVFLTQGVQANAALSAAGFKVKAVAVVSAAAQTYISVTTPPPAASAAQTALGAGAIWLALAAGVLVLAV